jgi:WD40 repeat protein
MMTSPRIPLPQVLLLLLALAWRATAADIQPLPIATLDRSRPVDFQREILPILRASCLACHNRTTAKAALILETPKTILKGSEDGPVVVPGKSDQSPLFDLAAHRAKPLMPPRDNKVSAPDLSPEQLALLKLWIDQGAGGEVRSEAIRWQPIPGALAPAYAVAVTADGQFAAVGRASQLHLYDLPRQRLFAPLRDLEISPDPAAHRDMIYSLAFSPDGTRLASGSFGEVKIWRRSAPAAVFSVTADTPTAIAASPDGKWLAIAGRYQQVLLINAASGIITKIFGGYPGDVRLIRFSPDGAKLLCAAGNSFRIWNIETGIVLAELTAPAEIRSITWTHGGKRLATGHADNLIRTYALSDSAPAALSAGPELKGHGAAVTALDALGPGDELLSGSADRTLRIWNLATGQQLRQLVQGADVHAVAARPDGKLLASAGENGVTRTWETGKDAPVTELKGDPELARLATEREADQTLAAADLAFAKALLQKAEAEHKSQQERVKKAADAIATAEKLAAEKAAARQAISDPKAQPAAESALKTAEQNRSNAQNESALAQTAVTRAAKAVADARQAITAAEQCQTKAAADAATARQAATAATIRPTRAIAFSPDGLTLATAGDDRHIHLWSTDGRSAPVGTIDCKSHVIALSWVGRDRILGTCADHTAIVWDVATRWSLERTIGSADSDSPLSDRVNALAFDPSGRILATGSGEPSRGGQVKLWDLDAGGALLHDLKDAHSDAVLCLAFSRDGRRLASGAADRFVKVLDVPARRQILSLEGHTHHVLGVSFKADGRILASVGADGQIKLWDLVAGERKANIPPASKELTSARFVGITDQAIVGSVDHQIRIITDAGASLRSFSGPADYIHAAAITADAKTYLCAGQSGALYLWDVPAGRLAATFPPPAAILQPVVHQDAPKPSLQPLPPPEQLFVAKPLTARDTFTPGVEGPACDAQGNVYAVNLERQQTIGRVKPDGSTEVFVTLPGKSVGNGIVFDRAGLMYVADYVGHNVLRINPKTREITVFAHDDRMNQPNDLTIAADGTVYASDPDWKSGTGQIWRIDTAGKVMLAAADMGTTNGADLSPDGKTLYVNESVQRNIWAFSVAADGSLTDKRLLKRFDAHGFDGMRCDVDGNLYVTRHGKGAVVKLSPDGKVLQEIDVLGKSPTNICFGGPDGRTAYVTEAEARRLVQFRTDRPGLAWKRWRPD